MSIRSCRQWFRETNLLITAEDSMEDIQFVKIGELTHPDRGYLAFDFVPEICGSVILALKSMNMEAPQRVISLPLTSMAKYS